MHDFIDRFEFRVGHLLYINKRFLAYSSSLFRCCCCLPLTTRLVLSSRPSFCVCFFVPLLQLVPMLPLNSNIHFIRICCLRSARDRYRLLLHFGSYRRENVDGNGNKNVELSCYSVSLTLSLSLSFFLTRSISLFRLPLCILFSIELMYG